MTDWADEKRDGPPRCDECNRWAHKFEEKQGDADYWCPDCLRWGRVRYHGSVKWRSIDDFLDYHWICDNCDYLPKMVNENTGRLFCPACDV